MSKQSGVEVRDVHDAWCGRGWDYRLNAALADEVGASSAFWTSAFDDIGASEVIVWARKASGLRIRRRRRRRTDGAKRRSSRGAGLAWGGVIRNPGMTVGGHGHHICECDTRGL